MKVISIGEILWDAFADTERLGGAPLNFAVHAARLGHEVFFISAVGADRRGDAALAKVAEIGLSLEFLQTVPCSQTGFVTVILDPEAQPDYEVHRPAAYDFVHLNDQSLSRLARWSPDWIYFGTLHQAAPEGKRTTRLLLETLSDARRFYDVNLRKACYTPQLVVESLELADVVKMNEAEAREIGRRLGPNSASLEECCRVWANRFHWQAVCITRGSRGCALLAGDAFASVPARRVQVADSVGAGDAFSAAFMHGLSRGWRAAEIAEFANSLGALIATRAGATPFWTTDELAAESNVSALE